VPGLGLAVCDQAEPFQRKIRVCVDGELLTQREVQDTPAAQAASPGPVLTAWREATRPGVGLVADDQAEPFQCKISVRKAADWVPHCEVHDAPTAQAVPPGPALTP
jgi:hypothetical protein